MPVLARLFATSAAEVHVGTGAAGMGLGAAVAGGGVGGRVAAICGRVAAIYRRVASAAMRAAAIINGRVATMCRSRHPRCIIMMVMASIDRTVMGGLVVDGLMVGGVVYAVEVVEERAARARIVG